MTRHARCSFCGEPAEAGLCLACARDQALLDRYEGEEAGRASSSRPARRQARPAPRVYETGCCVDCGAWTDGDEYCRRCLLDQSARGCEYADL